MGQKPNEDAVFRVAFGIESEQLRAEYLQQIGAADPDLRDRVESLLEASAEEPAFLEPPNEITCAALETESQVQQPGSHIGPYKLREEIAEGGMGVVFVAEQSHPIARKVALKVIKPGMDTKQVIARFEAERQALAVMDHPNVAKVLDAGSTKLGRPYFVMDLVRGLPITEYCDKQKLDPRQRLELFVKVCDAIQHAHQKGIIHRDIKPNNVLVTRNGERAVPKVIDFGVAKAINQRLTERTVYTQFNQLIGTPLYMSPEQSEMSELDVDTRSDIYSLGVLLYELLTGSTPFDQEQLSAVGYDELRRIIREQEPQRPSERISTLATERLSTVSDQRSSEPHKLGHVMRGDLDWIVMKALEKDRDRRYETASAMAADIGHYLNNEPVLACPPSAAYRLAKFVRRNKAAIITGALVTASLMAGIIGTTWQAIRVSNEQQRTATALRESEQKAAESQALADFLVNDLLTAADPARTPGHKVTVEEVLANAETKIEDAFNDQPLVEASVRHAMGKAYRALGNYEMERSHFARECELHTKLLGREHKQTLDSIAHLGEALNHLRKYSEAEKLHRETLKARRRTLGSEHPHTLASMGDLATSLARQGKPAEAVKLERSLLEIRRRVNGPDHRRTLGTMQNLASSLMDLERFDEAVALLRETLEAQRITLGAEHRGTLGSIYNLAIFLGDRGRYEESEQLNREALQGYRRVLGPEHRQTLRTACNLANSLLLLRRFDEAHRLAQQALEGLRRVDGVDGLDTLCAQENLAEALHGLGRITEARELWEEGLELSRRRDPSNRLLMDEYVLHFLRGLALNIALTEDAPSEDRRRAVALASQALELDTEEPQSWQVLGVVYAAVGQWQESLDAFERAVELGYQQLLIPRAMLERLQRPENEKDEAHQTLLEFLEKHTPTIPLSS